MKPTENQINTIYRWLYWRIKTNDLKSALNWAETNRSRKQTSEEMKRLYDLKEHNNLHGWNCFNSEYWEGMKEACNITEYKNPEDRFKGLTAIEKMHFVIREHNGGKYGNKGIH